MGAGGHSRLILERVLAALSVGAGACADRTVGGSENSGANAEGSSGSPGGDEAGPGMSSAATITSTSGTTTGPDSDTIDDMRFDVGASFDAMKGNPVEECTDNESGAGFPCDYGLQDGQALYYRCMPLPPAGTCASLDPTDPVAEANACLGPVDCFGDAFMETACGPDPGVADACCHWLVVQGQFCPGRPFTVGGVARLAATVERDDWACATGPLSRHSALSGLWAEHAAYEHASVASFSRFVLQLMAMGAPADLVARATRAAAEELEHARAFFGFASALAGRSLGPGQLAVDGALEASDDAHAITSAIREGCIAETISALQIAIAAERATVPEIRRTLARIADEELRHAELAWAFVGWVLRHRSPELRRHVAEAFADAAGAVPRGPADPPHVPANVLLAHGLLPKSVRLDAARRALANIVEPAARALMSVEPTAADAVDAQISIGQ